MTDLIKRLEEAEAGSRELDLDVHQAVGDTVFREDDKRWMLGGRDPSPVTTSLDAALALAERVLPGWWVEVNTRHMPDEHPRQKWSAEVEWPEPVVVQCYGEAVTSREFCHAFAPTPALALCAAILKATDTGREG